MTRRPWILTACAMLVGASCGALIEREEFSDAVAIVATGLAAYLGTRLGGAAVLRQLGDDAPMPGRDWYEYLVQWMLTTRRQTSRLRRRIDALERAASSPKETGEH